MKEKIRRAIDRFAHGLMCGFIASSGGTETTCGATMVQLYESRMGVA